MVILHDMLIFSRRQQGIIREVRSGRTTLTKTRETNQQKIFESAFGKRGNVSGAFAFSEPSGVAGKRILLFDDIFDSGATIKEIGRLFSKLGASGISPVVIAKTVGGDLA
jgi:ATP-dependent DNA helicase RecQ